MEAKKTTAEDVRHWPFTFRISRRERQLLRVAAEQQGKSYASVVREALDPLFAELAVSASDC